MSHKIEKRAIKASEIRIATSADGVKSLSGYAVVFNSPSVDLEGFTEVCSQGMFTRTLRDSPDILLLRDHSSSQLLARTTAGTLTLTQDAKGLAFTATLPKTAIAEDTVENIRAGNLNSCSFGFNVPDGGDKWTSTSDGAVLRSLLDVNLAEVSITSFAAYPATSVSLRSCPPSVRGLITRMNSDGCDCDCPECLADDCENCSDIACEDPNCQENGCPSQDEGRSKPLSQSERYRLHMRLEVARRK